MNGGDEELHREIERLSRKYGVLTPYTSFVAAKDGSLRRQYRSRTADAYMESIPISQRIADNRVLDGQKIRRHKRQYADTKYIGRKAFHYQNGIWIDSEYDGTSERKQVVYGSDEYFDLMYKVPDLKNYFKLALAIIVCYKGVNYEITPPTV